MNPEDAQAAAPSLCAAEVAERMRHAGADADVTGNGVVDETDTLAMLLHVTGRLPDLTALPDILSDSSSAMSPKDFTPTMISWMSRQENFSLICLR